jgi:hypothetical protein
MGKSPLCARCKRALVIEGESRIAVFCTSVYPPLRIRTPVLECTGYESRTALDAHALSSLAWLIDVSGDTHRAGFHAVRPSDRTEDQDREAARVAASTIR